MAEISALDEMTEDSKSIQSVLGTAPGTNAVHVSTLDPNDADLIERTQKIGLDLAPDQPHPSDPTLVGRAHLPQDQFELEKNLTVLRETLIDTQKNAVLDFPNLAWEVVKIGLSKEKFTNDQINGHVRKAEKIQKDIDLLLDLQAEMNALQDSAGEMTDKMKSILSDLKERGIDLWKEEGVGINKEKISQLKSLTSSQVDKLRSNLQILFTTKIQVMIQTIGAIMETLKDIVRNNSRLISRVNQLTTGR